MHSPEAVLNQPPPLEDYNLFDRDCALRETVNREGGGWIETEARKLGQILGKPETSEVRREVWGLSPIWWVQTGGRPEQWPTNPCRRRGAPSATHQIVSHRHHRFQVKNSGRG